MNIRFIPPIDLLVLAMQIDKISKYSIPLHLYTMVGEYSLPWQTMGKCGQEVHIKQEEAYKCSALIFDKTCKIGVNFKKSYY